MKSPIGNIGRSFPLGATPDLQGTNFSVFSRSATRVQLLLFDRMEDAQPGQMIDLDPHSHRTYHYWHVHVPQIAGGQIYGFRVSGPFDPGRGMRFDPEKLLLDPYGRAVVTPDAYDRAAAVRPGDNAASAQKSVVADMNRYDWEDDTPLRLPMSRTLIYEMHVRGFTRDESSGLSPAKRGTYAGIVENIPYLKDLGINALELLPVFQFDHQDCPKGLINYWGYSPVSFFAPHSQYSSNREPLGPLNEFRDMVKALHRAGIEVILDVVFNHTAEGDEHGPTFCFRGWENTTYYIPGDTSSQYANFSGTGNTLNANHPVVRRMILDSLRYWVTEMHVDGFRFDLASILTRDHTGNVLPNPPILWDIETDPILAGTKLVAEAWDAAGLYQVGNFLGDSWKEWNGRFRDDARDFFRAAPGSLRKFADRLIGSPEIYGHEEREPEQSVNFVTCHDGFTLADLVSYDRKHNEANCEQNRDGTDDNRSWNCGVEGPTNDPFISRLRNRQMKNFLASTFLSLGVPMIVMGDEVGRTQGGNNNAYCQDNTTSWFDWNLVHRNADIHRFLKLLIERRLLRDTSHEFQRQSLNKIIRDARKSWHGVQTDKPDWSDHSHSIALTVKLAQEATCIHLMFNAYWEDLNFELPVGGSPPANWRRWIDTALDSPADITPWQEAALIGASFYLVRSRSVVALWATCT